MNMCNNEEFTSEAPPITPGSGLYCYAGSWEEADYKTKACQKEENYCIEFTSLESEHVLRDCWDPAVYNKYNFTGCKETQACYRGSCFNSTVCICQDDLCNNFGMSDNATTPVPGTLSTTNLTMHCWYGIHFNGSEDGKQWQKE